MITYSIISRPIGYLGKIGIEIVIGVAYLCLVVALILHTITLVIFGINPINWWKHAVLPLIQGFSTQSSNSTLPITMDTLKNNIKVKESLVGISASLLTTMGLTPGLCRSPVSDHCVIYYECWIIWLYHRPFLYCFIGDSNSVIRNCWCFWHCECVYRRPEY